MGKWLIGCGVLVALVIGLLVAVFFVVKSEVQEFTDAAGEASTRLEEVKEKYPFTRPDEGVMSEDRLLVFLQAREKLSVFVEEQVESLEKGGNWFAKARKVAGAFQEFMPALADALGEAGMSPAEYAFISREIAYCIQYARRDEVLTEFPQMAELHGMPGSEEDGEGDDDPFASIRTQSENDAVLSSISMIDPYRLIVPRENLEIVARNTLRIRQTMTIDFIDEILLPMIEVQEELDIDLDSVEIPGAPAVDPAGATGG